MSLACPFRPAARRLSGAAVWLLLAAALAPAAATAQTGDPARAAQDDTRRAIDVRRQTQQQQDAWAEQQAALERRYRAAQADVAWLSRRRDDQAARLASLQNRLDELRRRLDEADRLAGSMQDTLQVVCDRLTAAVDAGLPFLPQERHQRLAALRAELARPDVPAAEKLRRVLEALQVEAGYASSVEMYQDEIDVDGAAVHADILRLGSVALFWRAPDGGQVGLYDQAAGRWRVLPSSAARRVAAAMEMAARRRPAELVALPLGRIAPPAEVAP